tara:strand:+ start:1290 stop:1772 length:483 start_codon:yes stop_codon:yes gene_type:complete
MRIFLLINIFNMCISLNIFSSNALNIIPIESNKPLNPISIENKAKIYSISGNKSGVKINKSVIGKPSNTTLKNLMPFSKRDKYALKVLNEDKKTIMIYGLGNPFYIHAQHIDFEDREFFGGYVNADFKVAFPLDLEISYLIFLEQNEGFLREINEIKLIN